MLVTSDATFPLKDQGYLTIKHKYFTELHMNFCCGRKMLPAMRWNLPVNCYRQSCLCKVNRSVLPYYHLSRDTAPPSIRTEMSVKFRIPCVGSSVGDFPTRFWKPTDGTLIGPGGIVGCHWGRHLNEPNLLIQINPKGILWQSCSKPSFPLEDPDSNPWCNSFNEGQIQVWA